MCIHHTENYQSTGNSLCDEELPVVTDTLYMAGMCVQNAKYFQTIDISNT